MPINRRLEFPDFSKMELEIGDVLNALPDVAANAAINFFQDRFTQKGWIDGAGLEKWEQRKTPDNGSLMLKTSTLKDSFDYETGKDWAEVTNYAPYSSIHNTGGVLNIKITKRSRKFFWYMFKKTGDPKWKYMAMSKKTVLKVKIPKRQHVGHSNFFMKRLDFNYTKMIEKLTKKNLK